MWRENNQTIKKKEKEKGMERKEIDGIDKTPPPLPKAVGVGRGSSDPEEEKWVSPQPSTVKKIVLTQQTLAGHPQWEGAVCGGAFNNWTKFGNPPCSK